MNNVPNKKAVSVSYICWKGVSGKYMNTVPSTRPVVLLLDDVKFFRYSVPDAYLIHGARIHPCTMSATRNDSIIALLDTPVEYDVWKIPANAKMWHPRLTPGHSTQNVGVTFVEFGAPIDQWIGFLCWTRDIRK